jgi:hypothetical protein
MSDNAKSAPPTYSTKLLTAIVQKFRMMGVNVPNYHEQAVADRGHPLAYWPPAQ